MNKELIESAKRILERTTIFDTCPWDVDDYYEKESLIDIINEARYLCKDIINEFENK